MEQSKWYLIDDKQYLYPVIRRSIKVDGKVKWERYPADEYKNLKPQEVKSLLRRLNATYISEKILAEERYNYRHAYISKATQDKYEEFLRSQANSNNHIRQMMQYLREHTLQYFVNTENLADPNKWRKKETEWGKWLVQNQKLSHSTIVQIIFNCNRFLKFLSLKVYPGEINPIALEPMSRNKLKMLKSTTFDDRYKFISPDKFEEIAIDFAINHKPLLPALFICYNFGLRISEVLGLDLTDVFEDSLSLQRQGKGFSSGKITTKPLKNLEKREVPYWFAKPANVYEWIDKRKGQHPDTLTRKINDALRSHGHESHDLRRSFVTRALRLHHWRDVMRAAGHKDMETTLRYDQPLTQSEKRLFKPTL